MSRKDRETLAVLFVVWLVFALATLQAQTFPVRARVFPQTIGILGFVFALVGMVKVVVMARRDAGPSRQADEETLSGQARSALPYFASIVGYYVGIYFIGFIAASAIFLLAFLTTTKALRWPAALASTAAILACLHLLANVMFIDWPSGLVADWPLSWFLAP